MFVVAICSRFDVPLTLGRQNWRRHCRCGLMMLNKGEESLLQLAGYTFASAASISLVFSATGEHCWFLFSFLSRGSSDSFGNSCFIALGPQFVTLHGVTSLKEQDFALACAEILIHLFLCMSLYIPVNGSPVFQCADSSP